MYVSFIWKSEDNLRCHFSYVIYHVFKVVSHFCLELISLGCLAKTPKDPPVSVALALILQVCNTGISLFYVVLGMKLKQSLCMQSKHFTN